MRSKLVLLILMCGVIWGIRAPVGGMWLYSWVTLFRPQDFTWLPLPNLVPIAFAIMVFSLLWGAVRGKLTFRWNIGSFHLLSILIVCFLSYCFSSTKDMAWAKVIEVTKIILPSLLISNSISNEKNFKIIVMTYAFSVGIWAIQSAIYGISGGGAVENMKIGGQMSDRNDFAVGIVMTWPLWYYFGLIAQNRKLNCLFFGGAFLVGLSVIISNSRGAMLGLAVVLFLNFMRKGTNRWRNLFLFLFFTPIIFAFMPDYALERLQTIEIGSEQTDESAQSRMILMKAGLQGAMDNPLFGVGTGCWGLHYHNYVEKRGDGAYEPHSIWIKMSVELGFIGFGTYLFMFARILFNLKKIQDKSLKSGDMKSYNYACMLFLAIIGYCASATFINQIFYEYMFLLIAVSGAFVKIWNTGAFIQKNNSVAA